MYIFFFFRASVKGELDVQQVMRGDVRCEVLYLFLLLTLVTSLSLFSPLLLRNALTTRFDGVDYLLDGAFGALSLLGVGWMASVLV